MTEQGTDEHWVSVQEAAQHLHIGERAVLKRIATGSLTAQRRERRWYVLLPDALSGAGTEPAPNTRPERPVSMGGEAAELARLVRELQRQNVELAEQVGYLLAELAHRDQQLRLRQGSREDEPASARQEPGPGA